MKHRTTLELWLDRIGPKEAKKALSKRTPELTRDTYVAEIRAYRKSVKIVTGEANSKLFNRSDLSQAVEDGFLREDDNTLQLVFHKDNDIKVAQVIFERENHEIVNLKHKFPERVHIYWSPIRPRQHYAVIDNGKKAILEEPNHVGGEPFWASIVFDESRAQGWANRFNEYIKHCVELTFEPSH